MQCPIVDHVISDLECDGQIILLSIHCSQIENFRRRRTMQCQKHPKTGLTQFIYSVICCHMPGCKSLLKLLNWASDVIVTNNAPPLHCKYLKALEGIIWGHDLRAWFEDMIWRHDVMAWFEDRTRWKCHQNYNVFVFNSIMHGVWKDEKCHI